MRILRTFPRIVALLLSLTGAAPLAHADEASVLKTALGLAASKDWAGASAAAQGAGQIAVDIIEWHRLRSGGEGRLGDYESFLTRHADWPGLQLLREKGEEAVARSTDPARIIAYFATAKPRTALGSITLIQALQSAGRPGEAEAEAFRGWAVLKFTAEEETALLALQGDALSIAHEVRLDNLLWDGRSAEARRMLPRVGPAWRALGAARIALREMEPNASALVDAVPAALAADPGLAYERFIWRMRKDRYDDAASLISTNSDSAAHLGRPELWAERRALLSRRLMRTGEPQKAYKIASSHRLEGGADYADLEFLSGFIALRRLNDPERALKHFNHLKNAVATPISLSRGDYWIGRAKEAAGDKAGATAAYKSAARYQTAYYGLLAAEKLGLSLDPSLVTVGEAGPGWKTAPFAQSSVLSAARLLSAAGDRALSKRFFLQLAEGLDAKGLEQLSDLALRMDEPHIAVLIGKAAAERGLILPRAYFPVPDMVPDGLSVSRALALAISRRESEFDPAAQSSAGARGLMQLLPETAERMAKKLGLEPGTAKLTTDPAYNVAVGSAYLAQMAEEFGPAVALIASGYNAGPGRPRQWITELGDPRQGDVVDWVESIPFSETRTYVMRVVEGVVIYRARLKGQTGPVRITAELTGQ